MKTLTVITLSKDYIDKYSCFSIRTLGKETNLSLIHPYEPIT